MKTKSNILYLSYTGLLEPLGQSQILAYMSRLSDKYNITIITFEKWDDYQCKDKVAALMKQCESLDITWKPRIYHHRPRLLATVLDITLLLKDIYILSKRNNIELIHCRGYISSIAAWLIGKWTKVPFIFDMRALWLEEMVDSGGLIRKSILFKILTKVERKLLFDSSRIVSLTQAAIPYLINMYPELPTEKFVVIPTCVDLSRFKEGYVNNNNDLVLGTMGTVISGWYHLDWMINTLNLSEEVFGKAKFRLVTKDDPIKISTMANSLSVDSGILDIRSSSPENIQQNIQDFTFAILLFTSGTSKIGSAPTRMAEFLACGIPIFGNNGVGDMASLISKHKVGVIVENGSKDSLTKGLINMKKLLEDEKLSDRCRDLASELFSADKGAQKYQEIYKNIIDINN